MYARTKRERDGMAGVILSLSRQLLNSMLRWLIMVFCNVPNLDYEQTTGSMRIERPLAGALEKAAGAAKARAR